MAGSLLMKICIASCLVIAAVNAKAMDRLYQMDKYVLYTDANADDIDQHVIHVEGYRAMVFRVRACANARMLMAGIYDHATVTTELVIGAESNTKTTLGYKGTLTQVASVDTPDVLHCNEMRAFWVSWAYGYLRVGSGSSLGIGMFLELQKTGDLNHDVTTINVFTGDGLGGVWEVEEGSFLTLAATPPALTQTPYPAMTWRTVEYVSGRTFFFTVLACSDVSIYLAESQVGAADYTIQLGHSGRNRILKGTQQLYEDSNDYLSCDKPRVFWITWWNAHLIMGSGFVRNDYELMSVNETGIDTLNSIGFAAGPNSQATFDFVADMDEFYTFETKEDNTDTYQHWLHVTESNFVTFFVRACRDVQIVFSSTLGSVSDNAVIMQLNRGGDTGSSRLIRESNGEELSTFADQVLECDVMTPLWASFADNKFRAGRYTVKGLDTFFAATTDFDIRMTGIGFGSDVQASWGVPTIEPGLLRLTTEGGYAAENHDTWATGNRKFYREFRLKMCQGGSETPSARISLTPCIGCFRMGSTGSYHVQIEADQVRIVHIQWMGDTEYIKTESVPGLANCDDYKSFYISWYNDIVVFGRGDLTDGDELIRMDEAIPYDVTDIAINSDSKCTWEWDMETGEQLSFQERSISLGYSWVKVSPRLTWQRFWITSTGIEIVLAATYGDASTAYKITFQGSEIKLFKNDVELESFGKTLSKDLRELMVLSWESGVITLGPETGGNNYITHTDNSPLSIYGIGVLPTGQSSEIRMPHTFASELAFTSTSGRTTIENWMELNHHDSLIFNVKGSADAEIVLAPYMYHEGVDDFYRLVIGTSSNQKTSILQGADTTLASVNTPNILASSVTTTFWIQWYHGEIIFGRGNVAGRDVVISYYDPSPNPINAAAFVGNAIEWEVALVPYGSLEGLTPEQGGGNEGGGGLSGGAIAGIIIGVLFLVAVIAGGGYMYQSGRVNAFTSSSSASTLSREPNQPRTFNNPISYPDPNAMPSSNNSAA